MQTETSTNKIRSPGTIHGEGLRRRSKTKSQQQSFRRTQIAVTLWSYTDTHDPLVHAAAAIGTALIFTYKGHLPQAPSKFIEHGRAPGEGAVVATLPRSYPEKR
jgi:hypothetical protein